MINNIPEFFDSVIKISAMIYLMVALSCAIRKISKDIDKKDAEERHRRHK